MKISLGYAGVIIQKKASDFELDPFIPPPFNGCYLCAVTESGLESLLQKEFAVKLTWF